MGYDQQGYFTRLDNRLTTLKEGQQEIHDNL
jgi:hypothetical protein